MPTLFPPLVDAGSGDASNGYVDEVLSPDLKANFEALTAIVEGNGFSPTSNGALAQDVGDKKRRVDGSTHTERMSDEFLTLDKSKVLSQAIPYELALATAISAEEHISALSNGIAELEALLAAGGDTDGTSNSSSFVSEEVPEGVSVMTDAEVTVGGHASHDTGGKRKLDFGKCEDIPGEK